MALQRRLRRAGNSLAITIPSQLAEMCGFRAEDAVEIAVIGRDTIRLFKAG